MKSVWVCMALVGGSLWAGAASAQMSYHCRDSNGNNYVLSRPCPSDMRTTAVVGGLRAPQATLRRLQAAIDRLPAPPAMSLSTTST